MAGKRRISHPCRCLPKCGRGRAGVATAWGLCQRSRSLHPLPDRWHWPPGAGPLERPFRTSSPGFPMGPEVWGPAVPGCGREGDPRTGWKNPITQEASGTCPRQTGGEAIDMPSSRLACAAGPDVRGHRDPAPPRGAAVLGEGRGARRGRCRADARTQHARPPQGSSSCCLSAFSRNSGPGPVARADILGAAGRVGRGAIWKIPGLGEHLCNRFSGEVWTMA